MLSRTPQKNKRAQYGGPHSSTPMVDTFCAKLLRHAQSGWFCISRARRARSPQRVARAPDKSHSRLHFAHSTRTISAEGCARMGQIAISLAFRALDTHDLRRGLRVKSPKRVFRTRRPQKGFGQATERPRRCLRKPIEKALWAKLRPAETFAGGARLPRSV